MPKCWQCLSEEWEGYGWLLFLCAFLLFSNYPQWESFVILYLQNKYIITNLKRIVSGSVHKMKWKKKKNKSEYTNFSIKETTFRINKSELTEHYYHVPGTFLSTSNVLTYLNQKRCIKRAWTTVNFSISIAWNEGIY